MGHPNLNRRDFLVSSAAAAFFLSTPSRSQISDPTELTIAQAAQSVRSRNLSPVDLVEAYLSRIDRYDSLLNAFITVTDTQAIKRAQVLENELRSGNWRGPMHGIPIALKDNIDTSGILTTAASAVFEHRIPSDDAEVVRRLENSGAIVLGKLNMHEFAFGATSVISHFGPVRNPWDLNRIAGGSSGGSGVAVAARLCAGALGTDTGGSVRIPAAHCGIVGLKATYGLASIRGIVPFSVSMDHVGPMCRTVEDAALMLQAIVGFDPDDVASIQSNAPPYVSALQRRTADLRLGVPRSYFAGVDPQIRDAVEEATIILGRMSAKVIDVALPTIPELPIAVPEIYAYHAELIKERRELYQELTLNRILRGRATPTTEYVQGIEELKLLRKAIARVFEKVDLLVTPTAVQLPVTIDEALANSGDEVNIRNTVPFNVYGIPSISIPCGFSDGEMPIGLQISGPALGEIDVLALAHAYEQVTKWHVQSPPIEAKND